MGGSFIVGVSGVIGECEIPDADRKSIVLTGNDVNTALYSHQMLTKVVGPFRMFVFFQGCSKSLA